MSQFRAQWVTIPLVLVLAALGVGQYLKAFVGPPSQTHAALHDSQPLVLKKSGRLTEAERRREAQHGGKFHKALKTYVDHPGIDHPPLQGVDDVPLVDETPIIGIQYEDQSIALVMEKMIDPRAHIVNLNFNRSQSISVSYCYLVECVRVLHDDSIDPIPLHVGGLDIENQLVFLYQGERYSQTSPDLPLEDYPFERTTLGEWKKAHPATKICIPPSRVSIAHREVRPG